MAALLVSGCGAAADKDSGCPDTATYELAFEFQEKTGNCRADLLTTGWLWVEGEAAALNTLEQVKPDDMEDNSVDGCRLDYVASFGHGRGYQRTSLQGELSPVGGQAFHTQDCGELIYQISGQRID